MSGWFAVAVVLAAGAACSDPDPRLVRLVAQEPKAYLDEAIVSEFAPVVSWRFDDPDELAIWRFIGVDSTPRLDDRGALVLKSSGNDPQMVRSVEFDMTNVEAFRVSMERLEQGVLTFFWAPPDEPFSSERSVSLRPDERDDEGYLFRVGESPAWSARIGRIRFDPTTVPGQEVRITEVAAIRRESDSTGLMQLANSSWKLERDNDVRNVIVTPPGMSFRRELVVPEGAGLQTSVATLRERNRGLGSGVELHFRIVVENGGERRVLWRRDYDLSGDRELGLAWEDVAVDLEEFAGKTITIAFEAGASDSYELLDGIPVWSHPEVVRELGPGSGPPNVILVSLDTLRADHLSLYGYGRETSPNIDAWARRTGVTFLQTIVAAPWTLPSHLSIFTGLDAVHHGVNHERPVPDDFETLAEILRAAGYHTAAATAGGYLHPRFGFTQGFDTYRHTKATGLLRGVAEITDSTDYMLSFLRENRERPFFFFLHTFMTHQPYVARSPYFEQLTGFDTEGVHDRYVRVHHRRAGGEAGFAVTSDIVWYEMDSDRSEPVESGEMPLVVGMYDSAIVHADQQLGRLLEGLRELGLEEDTVLVLTSDHGEAFGEQGELEHGNLSDSNLEVPLVIAYPGRLSGGATIPIQVRSVDILPTILELVGLPSPPDIDGVSLLPLIEGKASEPLRPEAWTYEAHTNKGMSLRLPGVQYLFNNAPWGPTGPIGRLRHLASGSGEGGASDAQGAAFLEARIKEVLATRPGLMINFKNSSTGTLAGRVEGAAVRDPARIKAWELPCRCVEWRDAGLGYSVPPGVEVTLTLEDVGPGRLMLTGKLDPEPEPGSQAFEAAVTPVELPRAWSISLLANGWSAGEAGDLPDTGVTLWWQGKGVRGSAGARLDPELERRLRALGYIR